MSTDNVTPIRGGDGSEPPGEPTPPERFLRITEPDDTPDGQDLVNALAAVCNAMDTLMVSQGHPGEYADLATAAMILSRQLADRVEMYP
jgi:hypothetical protein